MLPNSLLFGFMAALSVVVTSPLGPREIGITRRYPTLIPEAPPTTTPRVSQLARSNPNPLNTRDEAIAFPEIDATFVLSSTERRVASSGTYPRLAHLSDGGILSIATVNNNGVRSLVVSRSDDDGTTFSQIGVVTQSSGDLDNGFLLQLPSGVVLAAFRNHDWDANQVRTYFRISVCRSGDGGRSWEFASTVAEQPADPARGGYNGFWEPFMRIGNDGAIQLTYSGELSEFNQETFRALSHDEAQSWTQPVNLKLHADNQEFRDGMQGIVSVRDAATGQDTLVMVFEVKERNNAYFYLGTVVSHDDGNSWGQRRRIYTPPQNNAGAPQITALGGNLAVVFMTDEDIPVGQTNWPNNADIKAIFSSELSNGDATWTTQTMQISGQGSYWPGCLQMGTNSMIAVYQRGTPFGKTISKG
ncbi:glycoside hydrolase family 93 protein [Xylariaceae sp. FL0662B]|nr:glycoside hydrolase family 93 protein [Xylariaceae sp. FL0662B]